MFFTYGRSDISMGYRLRDMMRQPTRQDRKAKRTGPDGQVRTGGDPWKALSLPPVSQIGIVTRDLPKTVEHYSQVYGIGPWFRSRFTGEQHYLRGERQIRFDLDIALAFAGKTQYEVIEHKGGDRSIYLDHLKRHGEGVHHLGYYVDDFEENPDKCSGRLPCAR